MRRKECINDVELFSITKLSVLQKEKRRNYTSQTMIVPSFLFLNQRILFHSYNHERTYLSGIKSAIRTFVN